VCIYVGDELDTTVVQVRLVDAVARVEKVYKVVSRRGWDTGASYPEISDLTWDGNGVLLIEGEEERVSS